MSKSRSFKGKCFSLSIEKLKKVKQSESNASLRCIKVEFFARKTLTSKVKEMQGGKEKYTPIVLKECLSGNSSRKDCKIYQLSKYFSLSPPPRAKGLNVAFSFSRRSFILEASLVLLELYSPRPSVLIIFLVHFSRSHFFVHDGNNIFTLILVTIDFISCASSFHAYKLFFSLCVFFPFLPTFMHSVYTGHMHLAHIWSIFQIEASRNTAFLSLPLVHMTDQLVNLYMVFFSAFLYVAI